MRGLGTRRGGRGADNSNFHESLFGKINNRKVAGKPVKSRDLCVDIVTEELSKLPDFKMGGQSM